MNKVMKWVPVAVVFLLGCTAEKPKNDQPGLVSIPVVEKKDAPQVAIDPGQPKEALVNEPTKTPELTGDWTVSPPAGCRVGRVKVGSGGVVKAKMKASIRARSSLATMAQSLVNEIGGGQVPSPTVEETVDATGKKVRVVTTTTAGIDLIGVRQFKSKVEQGTYTAMFCLDPADVTASFRTVKGLPDERQTALLAKAEKVYGGLAAALSKLNGKPTSPGRNEGVGQ